MKKKLTILGLALLTGALAISGCALVPSAGTPTPSEQSSPPSDPVGARDAVLAYLTENYGDEAPAGDLAWTEKHTKPEGLVGSESYEYTTGDWVIAVSYPVVAPESVVYTIEVRNQATGFGWEGQVDARAQVTEAASGPFSDPFKYCAAVGTIDEPDERYAGPAAPEAVIEGLREKAGIAGDAPNDLVAAGTVWRCMDRQVWACFVGANLPCTEKADTSSTPRPEVEEFCSANPNADVIPAAVTGRATVYEWRCVDGIPQAAKQVLTPDAQGFLSEFWYELSSQ